MSPFATSGLRIGTPAVTTRGLKEEHMPLIVELIDEVILDVENEDKLKSVRKRVNELMHDFPMFSW